MHDCLTLKPVPKEFIPISQGKLIAGFQTSSTIRKKYYPMDIHLIWGASGKNICLNPETVPRTGKCFDESLQGGKIVKN